MALQKIWNLRLASEYLDIDPSTQPSSNFKPRILTFKTRMDIGHNGHCQIQEKSALEVAPVLQMVGALR